MAAAGVGSGVEAGDSVALGGGVSETTPAGAAVVGGGLVAVAVPPQARTASSRALPNNQMPRLLMLRFAWPIILLPINAIRGMYHARLHRWDAQRVFPVHGLDCSDEDRPPGAGSAACTKVSMELMSKGLTRTEVAPTELAMA